VRARYLVKNSFGFGGINACLVLGAAEAPVL
jgi:3-oxoacyl-(acyl-carrier-protein) synthase